MGMLAADLLNFEARSQTTVMMIVIELKLISMTS